MKIMIGMASLRDICEKACKAYRRELFDAMDMVDVRYKFDSLADVMKLWDAVNGFDCDELLLTIEKRDEERPVKVDVCH